MMLINIVRSVCVSAALLSGLAFAQTMQNTAQTAARTAIEVSNTASPAATKAAKTEKTQAAIEHRKKMRSCGAGANSKSVKQDDVLSKTCSKK